MSSEIKADKWSPASGTSGTIGDSGDTFTVPSGVTLDTSSSTLSLPSSVITSQTEKSSLVDADKFLISDSAASGALKYVQKSNLGAGNLTYLGGTQGTSNVSNVTLSNIFSDDYVAYYVYFSYAGTDTSGYARVQFTDASDSVLNSVNYSYAGRMHIGHGSSGQDISGASSSGFRLTQTAAHMNSSNEPNDFHLLFGDLTDSGHKPRMTWSGSISVDGAAYGVVNAGGTYIAEAAPKGLYLYPTSGYFREYNVRAWGYTV